MSRQKAIHNQLTANIRQQSLAEIQRANKKLFKGQARGKRKGFMLLTIKITTYQ